MVVIEASNRTSPVRLLVDENVGGNWQIFVQPLKGSARCVGVAVFVDPNEFGGPSFERFDTNDIEAFGKDNALQAYLDQMSDLLVKQNLRAEKRSYTRDVIRDLAQARTIAVLLGLDREHKRSRAGSTRSPSRLPDRRPAPLGPPPACGRPAERATARIGCLWNDARSHVPIPPKRAF
jgi:hypothetical protein